MRQIKLAELDATGSRTNGRCRIAVAPVDLQPRARRHRDLAVGRRVGKSEGGVVPVGQTKSLARTGHVQPGTGTQRDRRSVAIAAEIRAAADIQRAAGVQIEGSAASHVGAANDRHHAAVGDAHIADALVLVAKRAAATHVGIAIEGHARRGPNVQRGIGAVAIPVPTHVQVVELHGRARTDVQHWRHQGVLHLVAQLEVRARIDRELPGTRRVAEGEPVGAVAQVQTLPNARHVDLRRGIQRDRRPHRRPRRIAQAARGQAAPDVQHARPGHVQDGVARVIHIVVLVHFRHPNGRAPGEGRRRVVHRQRGRGGAVALIVRQIQIAELGSTGRAGRIEGERGVGITSVDLQARARRG